MDKDGLIWGDLLQQILALDLLSPVSRRPSAPRRWLQSDVCSWPSSLPSLPMEQTSTRSSRAPLPSCPLAAQGGCISHQLCPGLGLLHRAVLASTGFEFQSPNHPHALVCIWERDLRHKYLGTAASQCPPIVAEGVLIIPPCVHPKAWTSCWTRGCTRGK